ncbi:P-loop containing nucleoside triphosphate hydrolase protein [Globomyces pollinis-pini]|nr:P-loop containing nucleoside triphosphate hydrolase protein [Globomyces pollinis-pini]
MHSSTSNTVTFGAKAGDIRHGQSNRGPNQSTVDQRKLRNAEKKIEEKRKARGLYNGEVIPEWNPGMAPSMVVNQAKHNISADSRSKDIRLQDFDIQFAGRKILQNASLLLANGRRYGLVGKNGVGKSTLLRAISNGELYVPPHIRVLHVEQEFQIIGDDTPALTSVLQADVEREKLLEEERTINIKLNKASTSVEESAELSQRMKVVYQRLEDIESDKAESKASAILNGLGFTPAQHQAATKTFSGGWRMRLALARALFCRPDLLLADEVTNYLDFPAVVWLENYFLTWSATILVVSHDRSFLDTVTTDILHLHNNQLDAYRGNFTYFVGTRAEKRRNLIREYEAQVMQRQHLQDFIDRWRYNAKRSAQAQMKIKILEKMGPLPEIPKDDMEGMGEGQESLYFRFPEPEKLSPPILQMNEVTFGYTKERTILRNVSFDVQMDSKIAIVGPNGAGKSTLIHLLTGENKPNSGISHRHGRLRLALFSQHHVDQLELSSSSAAFLAKKFPGMLEEDYRKILGRFGLTGMTAMQPIGTLSGGQKSRVVFAWMSMMNPHILVLDEPTSHLDMDSIDALSAALREFKGGVCIVSHDQQFLDAVCSEVWICDGGSLKLFEGAAGNPQGVVQQYKASLLKDE